MLVRLNPAQHRLLQRHVERAVEVLQEADRLLKGAASLAIQEAVTAVESVLTRVDKEEAQMVCFDLASLPQRLVPYLDNPFAQALAFNRFCFEEGLSHTQGAKRWEGGNGAVTARNLLFLPPEYAQLWEEGKVDKTRLVAIANRNLKEAAYAEVADWIRTRRKEDLDERLLKLPPEYLRVGRRGPEQAMQAAKENGWLERFATVEIPEDLVEEAGTETDSDAVDEAAAVALRNLRAGLGGARVAESVQEVLRLSPDPQRLVEQYLTAHRQSHDPDPEEVTQTLFFAHAGPMQRIMADDKLLLRHFRPVKTQKRGQLFYRLLEVIEERLLEKNHLADLDARGITEAEATAAVREVILELNKDPNRYLVVPDDWLGEVTRRHLYFGSRTRKEGAAYKWFRKIGTRYFLGSHKTAEEVAQREARRASKA